jgi:hypothetical protein
MKKFYTLFIVLLIAGSAMTQTDDPCGSCLPDGITFSTQSQIDNFQTGYPNCTEIEGNVLIGGGDINNLNGLLVLTSIDGDLEVKGTSSLFDFNGLNNLTKIGGDLWIAINDSLTSLSGLENLSSVQGNVNIGDGSHTGQPWNPLLNSIHGLQSLRYIGGNLEISNHLALMNLDGLNNLDSIGGSLSIIINAIQNLSGLESLKYIGGDMFGGGISIAYNTSLNDLSGLYNLTHINGELQIKHNQILSSLSGLDNIDAGSISDLDISWNQNLSICEVKSICDYLADPNGVIYIAANDTNCRSQQEIEQACESASLNESPSLTTLRIFPNPVQSTITIELPTQPSHNTSLTISNANGQQLITQPITKPQTEIDISHLSPGIYIVKVWNDKEVMVRKVIKQ